MLPHTPSRSPLLLLRGKPEFSPQEFRLASPGLCRCIWKVALDTPCSPRLDWIPDPTGQGSSLSVGPHKVSPSSAFDPVAHLSGPGTCSDLHSRQSLRPQHHANPCPSSSESQRWAARVAWGRHTCVDIPLGCC